MTRAVAVAFSMLVCLAVGCADDEKSPVEKCDDFIVEFCRRGVECLGGQQQECVQAAQQSLACGRAVRVSASYDRCMSQIASDSCAVLFPNDPSTGQPTAQLPADCQSVILLQ